MQNMRRLALFAAIMLFAGLMVLVLTASPIVALFGKLAVAASLIGIAATATIYLMDLSAGALAIRNEDFHWH